MALQARVSAILADMRGALGAQSDGYGLIVVVSRIAAELGPGAALATRLRQMHDSFCSGALDGKRALEELRALREAELSAIAPPGARSPAPAGELSPEAVILHFGATESVESAPDDPQALATALYGPAYALAWLGGAEHAADIFRLPLDLTDPIDPIAVRTTFDAAVQAARRSLPALDLDATEIDFSSRLAFAWTLSRAIRIAAAGFAPDAPVRPRRRPRAAGPPRPRLEVLEEQLFGATVAALAAWTKRRRGAKLAQLSFDGTPPYEPVGICFDDERELLARTRSIEAAYARARASVDYGKWHQARSTLSGREWTDRHEPSEFSDHFAAEFRLGGFEAYSAQAPSPREAGGDTWAAGSMRVLFARVVDRLVRERVFDRIPCAPEVFCGYALHDEPAVVLRIVDKRGTRPRTSRGR
jgi:hypothetical protein